MDCSACLLVPATGLGDHDHHTTVGRTFPHNYSCVGSRNAEINLWGPRNGAPMRSRLL